MRQRRSTHNYKRSASTRWQSMRSHSSHIGPSRKTNNVQGGTDVVELDNEAHERNAREGSNLCNEPGIIVLTLDEVRQADGRTWVTHPCPSACCTLAYDRSAAQTCTSTKIPQTSLLPFANFRSRRTTPEHRAAEKLLANNLQSLAGYGSANFVSSLPSLAPCSCT